MQALTSRCTARVQPFTSGKPVAARPCIAAAPRTTQRVASPVSTRAVADVNVDDYADEVDVPLTPAAELPMAGEKVRLRIRMRSYEVDLLNQCIADLEQVAAVTGATFKGPVMLPTKRKVYCVLRSPHVNKDAREHFEIRTHHRLVDLKNLSVETVSMMMNWVPPAGVEVECSIA